MEKDIKRFDYWFSHNYQELRNKLYGAFFNEDIFHDTYLYIRNIIKTNNVSLIDFEPFFIVCYKRNRQKNLTKENRYCKLDMSFFQSIKADEELDIEELSKPDRLAYSILSFIKKQNSAIDYRLFKLKVYDTNCSYQDLSAYTGSISKYSLSKNKLHHPNSSTRTVFSQAVFIYCYYIINLKI
ncbi:sigma-70 family RNA polymerase sigma factor [Bacteroides salyersiae]|nr:sigma-70 family RNA polymerase sigma factor [Bacteroides salyersiae]